MREVILRLIICTSIISAGFLVFASEVLAQIIIGDFYSLETSDWVEIKNMGGEEVNLMGYQLGDTASTPVYEWKSATWLSALGSCVIEVGNRLNNKGDTIYLRDASGAQIDCVLYGDGNGGDCGEIKETLLVAEKPASNCFVPTPSPTIQPSPTEAVVAASLTPEPSPTRKPTQPPATQVGGQAVKATAEVNEKRGEKEKVLGVENQEVDEREDGEKEVVGGKKLPWVAGTFVLAGVILVGSGLFPLYKPYLEKYNLRIRGKNKEEI